MVFTVMSTLMGSVFVTVLPKIAYLYQTGNYKELNKFILLANLGIVGFGAEIVPSTGHMVINPYRLAVRPDGVETTAQLVHAPQALTNLSDFPVTVNVTASASLPRESEAVFVHAPPAPDAKAKEVFLYAEFQERPDWWEGAYLDLPNQIGRAHV